MRLADRIVPMTNKTGARIAEVVSNRLPRDQRRGAVPMLDALYPLRNHLIDFLVRRSTAKNSHPATPAPSLLRPVVVLDATTDRFPPEENDDEA